MKKLTFLLSAALLAASPAWAHGSGNAPHTSAAAEQQDWGIAGDARKVQRTITLTMGDNMRFSPDRFEVRQGETVRLRVRNTGKLQHELVLGTRQALQAHAAAMLKHPDMEHDEAHMVHVAPGKTGEIIWTFNRAGEFEFACLIAGHFQAGMKGTVLVRAAPGAAQTGAAGTTRDSMHAMHAQMMGGMHGSMHGALSSASQAQGPAGQPYAGQQQRGIKALSEEDLQAYAQGQGYGLAKAAELNGYPGPMHVLQLSRELELSDAQRQQSEALLSRHKAEARRLGAELIEAERALDQAFAGRQIDTGTVQRLTLAAGEKQARLRAEHLRTHLAQTALLTPQQIERYNSLRGYASSQPMHQPEMQHGTMHQ